jgi:pre-60S factor REI1
MSGMSNRLPFCRFTTSALPNRLVRLSCTKNSLTPPRHRYNLKRKIAELSPITAEAFAQKVIAQQDQLRLSASQANYSQTCVPCKKTFYSANAYNNHLSSRRHRLAVARSAKQFGVLRLDDVESVTGSIDSGTLEMAGSIASLDDIRALESGVGKLDIVEENDDVERKIAEGERHRLPIEVCLFCLYPSATLDDNILHMNRSHGLFIPEQEYLVDKPGLIRYLSDKITVGNACIYCSRTFTSPEAIRAHMIDKGHCKMSYSTASEVIEYADYYDFSASYPPAADVVEDDNDSNWSDDDSASSIASEDLQQVHLSRQDILELRLPHVGKVLGHRSLARYYRQNLRPTRVLRAGDQTHQLAIEDGPAHTLGASKAVIGVRKFGERSMMVEAAKRRHVEREARRFRDHRKREQQIMQIEFRRTAEHKSHYRGTSTDA